MLAIDYQISGELKYGEGKMLYLEEIYAQEFRLIDTVTVNNKGEFTMKAQLANQVFLG